MILVLMGGGMVVLSPLLSRPSQACIDARQAQRPDADQICRTSGHGGGHGFWSGGSGNRTQQTTTTTSGTASVERGGFGGTGFHVFGFGG